MITLTVIGILIWIYGGWVFYRVIKRHQFEETSMMLILNAIAFMLFCVSTLALLCITIDILFHLIIKYLP